MNVSKEILLQSLDHHKALSLKEDAPQGRVRDLHRLTLYRFFLLFGQKKGRWIRVRLLSLTAI